MTTTNSKPRANPYCRDGKWYFKTEKGIQHGPFNDGYDATYALLEYIAGRMESDSEQLSRGQMGSDRKALRSEQAGRRTSDAAIRDYIDAFFQAQAGSRSDK